MKKVMFIVSLAALVVAFLLPTLYAANICTREWGQYGVNIGTLTWFVTAPFWIRSGS